MEEEMPGFETLQISTHIHIISETVNISLKWVSHSQKQMSKESPGI
jgi:hypothetical protein